MTRVTMTGAISVVVLALLFLVFAGRRVLEETASRVPFGPGGSAIGAVSEADTPLGVNGSPTAPGSEHLAGYIVGRVTTQDGVTYEGRLRLGGDEEGFWGDYFNGSKEGNRWAAHVPPEQLLEPRPLVIFGIELGVWNRRIGLDRPFMARFGDITRIEALGEVLEVTMKSGSVFHLDRYAADDLADGVRVWDAALGVVDLGERRIHAIDLVPGVGAGSAPDRLYGTVRSQGGDFTGFLQWDREKGIGSDELVGRTAVGETRMRFDTIRSIARASGDTSVVTLVDGREVVLSGIRNAGDGNRGIYVDDPRFGRVLVSWRAFQRVDFEPGHESPAYDDFPPGSALGGSVTTRDGRRFAGRLVYDLDESETVETLDAPSRGVDYTIFFGLVASIVLPDPVTGPAEHATVTLHGGEELALDLEGDLADGNAGLLVFEAGTERARYVRWVDVERVDFDRPPAMYPPLAVPPLEAPAATASPLGVPGEDSA